VGVGGGGVIFHMQRICLLDLMFRQFFVFVVVDKGNCCCYPLDVHKVNPTPMQ